jgi:hypothetical protein
MSVAFDHGEAYCTNCGGEDVGRERCDACGGEGGALTETQCFLTEPCAPLGCVTRSVPADPLDGTTQCAVRNDCGGYGPSYGPQV